MDRAVVGVAELLRGGLHRLDVDAMSRVGGLWGLRTSEEDPLHPWLRVQAALCVAPPDAVLAGWAAALAHGVPTTMLDGTWDGDALMPVPFVVPERSGCYVREGLKLWKGPLAPGDVVEVAGVRATSGPRTVADLARWARHPARAQAMVDLGVRYGLVDATFLPRFLETMKGYRGIRYAREAAQAPSARAESQRESELRYYWREAGLPEPLANADLFDSAGEFLGRADLFERESGYIGEYDGRYHREGDRPRLDALRIAGFRAVNLTVDVFTEEDFRGPAAGGLEGRLRNGWNRARRRDPALDAWRCSFVGA